MQRLALQRITSERVVCYSFASLPSERVYGAWNVPRRILDVLCQGSKTCTSVDKISRNLGKPLSVLQLRQLPPSLAYVRVGHCVYMSSWCLLICEPAILRVLTRTAESFSDNLFPWSNVLLQHPATEGVGTKRPIHAVYLPSDSARAQKACGREPSSSNHEHMFDVWMPTPWNTTSRVPFKSW